MRRMGIKGALIVAAAFTATAWAGPPATERRDAQDVQVVRAWFADTATLERVTPLFEHAQVDRAKGVLRVETDAYLRAQLIAAGLRVEVDAEATAATQRLAQALATKAIPGYACYRTVEEAQARIVALATAHPQLATYQDIGPSWERAQGLAGYPLRVLKATNSAIPGPKPVLFLIGSIHAREYTPAELVLRFVEELIEGYGNDADATWILDHHEIHALVHANPDGRKRAETGLLWRKNTNNTACPNSNSRGIDLNRNFPFEWGNHNGSSPVACNDTYRGPSANSEPETQAIVDYTRSIFADSKGPLLTDPAASDTSGVFMDIHSYSQLVLWPWGFTTTTAPNATALQVLGRRIAGFNNYAAQAAVGLYPTDGTTDDFAYGELGVPAYTIELGSAFFESCSAFETQVLPLNRDALHYTARTLRAPYLLPAGPDARSARVTPDLILAGDDAVLSVTFDDERQQTGAASQSGPVPATQAIASANAYLHTPPWLPGATPLAMQAADGGFDAKVETAHVALDTDGWSPGKHLLFAQGRDSAGSDGPVTAAFVEVVSPAEAAVLSGVVTDIGTGAPLGAQIAVGAWRTDTLAADGGYERVLRAGAFPLTVSAAGYESQSDAGFSIAAGQSLTRDFALYRVCPLLADAAEVGQTTPFAAQSPWTRRSGAGIGASGAWLQSASGNYADNLDVSLTSATLNLSGYSTTSLAFDQRCDTEAGWDYGIVEVSTNGGTNWSEVFRCNGETSWRRVELSLSQLDGQASARLRFRFTSDTNTTRSGWAVDNLVLSAGGATCRAGQLPSVRVDSFGAAPETIELGQASTLSWTTAYASACSIASSLGGAPIVLTPGELASGLRQVDPAEDVTYTLSCSGNNGPATRQVSIDVQAPPAVAIASFSASPTQLVEGASSTLAWSTQHASRCEISNDLGDAAIDLPADELASGTRNVTPAQDATYTLTCQGAGGPVSSAAAIDVLPPVAISAFDATPAQIVAGASSTLNWTTQHASNCSIASSLGGAPEDLAANELASGSRSVSPAQTATYTLACDGPGDAVSAQATVTVASAPAVVIDAFAANPPQVALGQSSILSWQTQHATQCAIATDLGEAPLVLEAAALASGTLEVTPTQAVVYTLTCSGITGAPVSQTATITLEPPLPMQMFQNGFESGPVRAK